MNTSYPYMLYDMTVFVIWLFHKCHINGQECNMNDP